MPDVRRLGLLLILVLLSAWPVSAAVPLAPDQLRQHLTEASVRIEIDTAAEHGLCTGWVGWSEENRSAVYTAGHCFRDGARYRLILANGDAASAIGLARWDELDLMALWIPRGHLRALRDWKPIPDGPFRALYILQDRGNLRVLERIVSRIFWEIRFENHPAAVAIPLYTIPGTSGAPIVDMADGMLVGMVVGYLMDRTEIAAMLPASHIYDALVAASGSRQFRQIPLAVPP